MINTMKKFHLFLYQNRMGVLPKKLKFLIKRRYYFCSSQGMKNLFILRLPALIVE